jgi:phospholipase/carboxylesterase
MADKIVVLIRELETATPRRGKAIVTGFSMGGVLAFVIAARHPDRIAGAVPIGGHLPRGSWPVSRFPAGGPVVRAFNGEADPIVSASDARAGIAKLATLGLDARIRLYQQVEHRITDRMRADIHATLGEMVRQQAGLDPRAGPAPCGPCPGDDADAGSCGLCR